ncbi:hypothetical protein [Leifsonia sp. NPDC058248]|uniref:hypothetical protein n=1 Tax=Leifsonia sp. NPDC058248 TaxID=3346402 RepID=UPI0036DF7037
MTVIVVSFRCGNGKAMRGSRIPMELLVSVVLSYLVGMPPPPVSPGDGATRACCSLPSSLSPSWRGRRPRRGRWRHDVQVIDIMLSAAVIIVLWTGRAARFFARTGGERT